MSLIALASSVDAVPPPPCERFGRCQHYEYCATQSRCCDEFIHYVSINGRRRARPTRDPVHDYVTAMQREEAGPLPLNESIIERIRAELAARAEIKREYEQTTLRVLGEKWGVCFTTVKDWVLRGCRAAVCPLRPVSGHL